MPPHESPVIIVLGAPNDDQGRLLAAAVGRAEAAAREYRRDPGSRLLLTGGIGPHFNRTSRPHHEYVAAFLEGAGVPRGVILGGVGSRSTVEDAGMAAELLAGHGPDLYLRVVTSDYHLARARLLFERAFAGHAAIEMVPAAARISAADLAQALRHEAEAIERL
jgi:uncharacterized SAM-binding protein YcdF (DUF218 family)